MIRPASIDERPEFSTVYDWLADNDVVEWLPSDPIIEVRSRTLSYTAYGFEGPRGWDPYQWRERSPNVCFPREEPRFWYEWRTVPLRVPLNDLVLECLLRSGAVVQVVDTPTD